MRRALGNLGLVALLGVSAGGACGGGLRPYPLAEPMWVDPDTNHVSERPEEYFSPFAWDAVDQTFFRPLTRFLAVDPVGPAVNVNAFDEVPASSWWTNRIGLDPDWSVEDTRLGACPDEAERIDLSGPWTVTDAKPNGANPGFIIRAADGRRYLLKFDGHLQPERATSADVFGSRLYHAAGFWAPCNFIVFFDRDRLVVAEDATAEDEAGEERALTEADVEQVLAAAVVLPDGRLRASASLFLEGRPIGPWRYQGTRDDDPNDVVPHQERRELRGGRVLAAWVNHTDTREQNTLAVWIDGEVDYVRHYYIDFGDGFGSLWDWDGITRRLGYSNYLDLDHVVVDFFTLGLVRRPWDEVEPNARAPIFGYFDSAHFEPDEWEPGYPNPAFSRMTDEDGAWMARIIARFGDEHVRAMLDEVHLSDPEHDAELFRIVTARRDRILATYLPRRSPLSDFTVEGGDRLCFTDLATATGVFDGAQVRYASTMYFAGGPDGAASPVWVRQEGASVRPNGEAARACVSLLGAGAVRRPARGGAAQASDDLARYGILDLIAYPEAGADPVPPARLHFYDLGEGEGFRLVAIERPADGDPPE
jgi:hypothetical protein